MSLRSLPSRHPEAAGEIRRRLFEGGGEELKLSRRYLIIVNGRYYAHLPGGLDYRLREGDVIAIFPPLGGG